MGLDVHKETIAVAEAGRQESCSEGEIANRPKSIEKLVSRLSERFGGGVLQFVYEAVPCGYGPYHQLAGTGHICEVVAPSHIPKAPAERIKIDCRNRLGYTPDFEKVFWIVSTIYSQTKTYQLAKKYSNNAAKH